MSQKTSIWLGMFIGSSIGSFVPSLWNAGIFSLSAIVFSALGGFLGIYLGFRLAR